MTRPEVAQARHLGVELLFDVRGLHGALAQLRRTSRSRDGNLPSPSSSDGTVSGLATGGSVLEGKQHAHAQVGRLPELGLDGLGIGGVAKHGGAGHDAVLVCREDATRARGRQPKPSALTTRRMLGAAQIHGAF
jgi:hypothetical protein